MFAGVPAGEMQVARGCAKLIGGRRYPEATALAENRPAERSEPTSASPRRCRLTAGQQQWGAGRWNELRGFARVRICGS